MKKKLYVILLRPETVYIWSQAKISLHQNCEKKNIYIIVFSKLHDFNVLLNSKVIQCDGIFLQTRVRNLNQESLEVTDMTVIT